MIDRIEGKRKEETLTMILGILDWAYGWVMGQSVKVQIIVGRRRRFGVKDNKFTI